MLAIAVVAVYYPVHWQPFANYDDPDYVSDNFHVRAGLTWTTIKWAITARDAANWHPVTWLSHALDCQLFGLDSRRAARRQCAVSHCECAAAVLGFAARDRLGRPQLDGRRAVRASSDQCRVGRLDRRAQEPAEHVFLPAGAGSLSMVRERPIAEAGPAKVARLRYLLVAGLFALGLMSKAQVITLPFVLLLWDYWPLGRMSFDVAPAARAWGDGRKSHAVFSSDLGEGTPAGVVPD